MPSKLFLIPNTLGNPNLDISIPNYNITILKSIDIFIVENANSARFLIKKMNPDANQNNIELVVYNKKSSKSQLEFIKKMMIDEEKNYGLISEAGLPAIADPGTDIVMFAHKNDIEIIPLVGASSMMMALMSSGLTGEKFIFHNYIPINDDEKRKFLKKIELDSKKLQISQIFMETPYRNNKTFSFLINNLEFNTRLCIACNITMPNQFIKTKTIKEWLNIKIDFDDKPCIFIL